MSALTRFTPEQLDALRRGRAIPFLIEHRDSTCPGRTLSVIATLDDEQFCGLFLPDDKPDCDLVTIPIDGPMLPEPYPITSDAPDARVIHRLWSNWENGVRERYLSFFALMGRVLARDRLDAALRAAPPPREPDAPASKPKVRSAKRATSRRGAKPRQRRPRA